MKNIGTVEFLLNGQLTQIDFHGSTKLKPTNTLLEYLRQNPNLQGTKEGCAEGDCGACTVVLVSPGKDETQKVKAVDSCLIFLPMLHGKAVITVEYIGSLKQLHPVQKAMIDLDGSQCGYCTPGFIMSLYALHTNHKKPSREITMDALTGNLCRCTGYRSILEASQVATNYENSLALDLVENDLIELNRLKTYPIAILQEYQKYFQPNSLAEAIRLRNMYPSALLINGATDVALQVTKQDQLIPEIIDLSKVPELVKITTSNDAAIFGSGVTLEEVNQESKEKLPALSECLKVFGSLQIRNLATIGGNIASASPIGDLLPILMAYGAKLELLSNDSQRIVPIREFITGYRKSQLKKNEIITNITVPIPKTASKIMWYKISKRRDLDISTVSGGFLLELDSTSKVIDVQLYYGGMAEQVKPALNTSNFLKGKLWAREIIDSAVLELDKDFTPISDARAEAIGRKIMGRNLLWKFWSDTHEKN